MFPNDFLEYLHEHTLTGIKGGRSRPTFLNIWMVNVEGRVFARSWNRSSKSWFTEFQKSGIGQIKYGDNILDVFGKKLDKEDPMNLKINEAYLKKYVQPENLFYAEGISRPEAADFTMEFSTTRF